MADVLLNIVIEGVLNKLISLVAEEINIVSGVKEDLKSLAQNLEKNQALLLDAECNHNSSNTVDLWLKRLRDVSFEAEDLLEEFAYEVLRNKLKKRKQDQVCSFFSCSCPLAFRFKFAHKIKNMNLRIEKVYQEGEKIRLSPVEIGNMSNNPRSDRSSTTDPFVDDSSIVGRSEVVNEAVKLLTPSEKDGNNLSVIGIVGMAGLGKTTIAQLVYQNEKVRRHFDHKFWIHVSEDFNVERLLNKMVEPLTGTNPNLTVGEAIVGKLNEVLRTKRFLLVLDDVWNEDAEKWDRMRECLRGIGASDESRIIVTTRNQTVVSIMQASFTCQLGTLSDGDSWELFEKTAFGPGCAAVKTPELINIGRKIVAKCGGVPLAVKAIGGLLWSKKDEREWSRIENSKTWDTMEEAGRRVRSAIKLSYDHLPSLSLKQCLLYCTIMGKGGVAPVEIMIQLWMAQGLLNPSKESDLEMEDVGSNYMSILFRTSLLQVSGKDGFGRTIYFTIHDLVFNFVEEAAKESIFLVPSVELRTDRESLSKLRTSIVGGGIPRDLPIVRKSLRVLFLVDVKELPTTIGKLKLLRYLDISRTSITKLPNPITRLYNLQTIRLSNLQQLPKNFGNLANLRHLCIEEDGIINGKPCLLPDIGQLSSLQTSPFFYVSQDKGCQIDQLGHLHNLRGDLKIFDLQNVSNQEEAIKAKISTKINLDSLELHWDTRTRDESTDEDVLKGLEPHPNLKGFTMENFMGRSLPSWMLTTLVFRNLVKIVLRNFNECQQIPPLGHLPHLNIVNIIGMKSINCIGTDFLGWKNVDDASSSKPSGLPGDAEVSFLALKELILEDMPDLIEWSGLMCHDSSLSSVNIFPSLEIFRVKICPKLVSLPDSVWHNLRCIKELCISGCNSLSHLPKDVGGLASLELLTVMNCPNLVSIPDIHSLRSLVELILVGCDNLRSLPSGIEVCTSIRFFFLLMCPAIRPEDLHHLSRMTHLQGLALGGFSHDLDYFPWPGYTINPCRVSSTDNENKEFQYPFASLLSLFLYGRQAVTSLPEQIQHLSHLVILQIARFDGIVALPEFLGSIHSLEQLHIKDCKNLLYLPSAEAMRRLTKLRKLVIEQCPLLKDRCKKEIGQEWYKIADIPEIQLLP